MTSLATCSTSKLLPCRQFVSSSRDNFSSQLYARIVEKVLSVLKVHERYRFFHYLKQYNTIRRFEQRPPSDSVSLFQVVITLESLCTFDCTTYSGNVSATYFCFMFWLCFGRDNNYQSHRPKT